MTEQELIDARHAISDLDQEIIEKIRDRTQIAVQLGNEKVESGGTRISADREFQIVNHYSRFLGVHGRDIATALLKMSRGK